MGSIIETIKVVDEDCAGGYRIINKSDLQDADTLFDDNKTQSLTVAEIKDALTAKGVEFNPTAKKAELQELLDAQTE
jgi:hypothetical protein